MEPLAREFARRSKEFHSLQCDTAVFRSYKEKARFVEVYGAEYYGNRWHSRELDEKLDKALCLKMGMSIASRPRSAFMFLPYIMGRKFRANLIAGMCDLFLTEKIYRKKSQAPGREG